MDRFIAEIVVSEEEERRGAVVELLETVVLYLGGDIIEDRDVGVATFTLCKLDETEAEAEEELTWAMEGE